ncbi:MAG: CehA/McbA family metallohydrolase [Dehalococcoidia bacterium]
MGKADLHIHTRVSDGLATVEQAVAYIEHETDLDAVAITDHEDATGGHRARELAAKRGYRLEVVVGAEVTTIHGHLLALFIEEAPPLLRSVEATLEAIHRQGGLAVIPHPMSWLTRSLSRRTIDRIMARDEAGITFDAIEVANPSPAGKVRGTLAAALNERQWLLPETGSSDAHHLPHIGAGWTEFDGATADDLREAIVAGKIVARQRQYPGVREVGLGRLVLGLAWGYTATPRKLFRRAAGG